MNKIAYIEVCQKATSTLLQKDIETMAKEWLDTSGDIYPNTNLLPLITSAEFNTHIESFTISTNDEEFRKIKILDYDTLRFFVYRLSQEEPAMETMQHDSEHLSVASHVILPSVEFEGLWETLYYDTNIKNNLLNFVETTMLFSDRKVDNNIISWNKVVLLHGPPGTGKTSLCKALAQKAAIRLGNRYACSELIEINSHSLFSKWFSESGKLVMKLFDEVRRLLDNPDAFVCVLIDEVESLAHARKSCANGTEPSDAIRVVNALLTQLDQIKRYPNVLILTTSNVTEAIDLAFVDRADIKQYIGNPKADAIYKIYRACLTELMRTNIVQAEPIMSLEDMRTDKLPLDDEKCIISRILYELSIVSLGLSGRSLRKIPFLAHAMHVQASECPLINFLGAMQTTIEKYKKDEFLSDRKDEFLSDRKDESVSDRKDESLSDKMFALCSSE